VIYLAFGAFNSWKHFDDRQATLQTRPRSIFKAAFVNLLSPNPYLFWSLVGGPLLLTAWREAPVHGLALLLGFYLILIGSMAGIILLIGSTGKLGAKFNRVLLGISALALFGMGIYQIWLGLSGFLK
jgi:threonine/homoserine/homoserine lactone efflux protein